MQTTALRSIAEPLSSATSDWVSMNASLMPDLDMSDIQDMPAGWTLCPISPAAGLEIGGIFLETTFSDSHIALLRRLLCRFKVLVFRNQQISAKEHVDFTRRFGELEINPLQKHHPDHPELVTFVSEASRVGRENVFHADTTWLEKPSMGSVLRCIECPEVGGDTIFVNMALVYENLPPHIKERIAPMTAFHDASLAFQYRAVTPDERQKMRAEHPPIEHPVVRTHPETGEKILFINDSFTSHIANYRIHNDNKWNQDEPMRMHELFIFLLRQSRTPEFHTRIRWQKNTIVFWDNRAVQHYAVSDYYPKRRSMARATVIGDRPY